MHTEHLNKLIGIIDDIPDDSFYMHRWWNGKSGCVIGWACRNEYFNSRGLYLMEYDFGGSHAEFIPRYNDEWNFDAVAAFFQITFEEAAYLFDRISYHVAFPSKYTVKNRLIKFIENGQMVWE